MVFWPGVILAARPEANAWKCQDALYLRLKHAWIKEKQLGH